MTLKKHHKIVIGSFSSFLIILLIANSLFIYFLYAKIQYDYRHLSNNIMELRIDTQSKLNELSLGIIQAQNEISKIDLQVGSIGEQFDKLQYSTSPDFSNIITDVVESVVTIRTDVSQGSGFIIHEEGYVITNRHIMERAKRAAIYTFDEKSYEVILIGHDPLLDLSLLKINGSFQKLSLGDSDRVQVGEKVIAIGNPLGLQFSVSEGIVSGIHRRGPNNLDAYIQTDAALNPGNSGGPLINKQGDVIGINNFKIGTGESLGFALESNYIKNFVNEIFREKNGFDLID